MLDDLWVVFPEKLAAGRVDRAKHVVAPLEVHHAVHHQRRPVQRAVLGQLPVPGDAQIADVGVVDLRQRAVALFVIGAAEGEPVVSLRGVGERGVVDHPLGGLTVTRDQGEAESRKKG